MFYDKKNYVNYELLKSDQYCNTCVVSLFIWVFVKKGSKSKYYEELVKGSKSMNNYKNHI